MEPTMWKSEKPVSPSTPLSSQPTSPVISVPVMTREARPEPPQKTGEAFRAEVAAHIGKSVVVKGELSGSEDLYLDGEVEGTIELRDHSLVVGPNGRIRANITARELIVHGKAEGNVHCTERVELKKSCVLVGDIITQRVVIEDGAFFKGAVDLHREKAEPRKAMAAAAGASVTSQTSSTLPP